MSLSIQAFNQLKMARWFLFFMTVAHAIFIFFLSVTASSDHDLDKFPPFSKDSAPATKSMRKLMEGSNTQRTINKENIKLDDYSPIDPVPSASSAVSAGPIEHGTPLLPYIPKLAPPYVGRPFPPPPA